jgi:hypothetical protein
MFSNIVHAHHRWDTESIIFGGHFKDMEIIKDNTRYTSVLILLM